MLQTVLCGAACAAAAYLLGSLSFSIIVTRLLYHKDIRTFGSGNAGMTNVLRTFGKGAAALTIVGDIGKGILAVLLAKWAFGAFTAADPIYGAYIAAFVRFWRMCTRYISASRAARLCLWPRARSLPSSRCLFCLCWRCFLSCSCAAKWFLWQASAARRRIPPLHFCTFILWLGATSCLPLAARRSSADWLYGCTGAISSALKTGRNTSSGGRKNKDGLLSSGRFTAGAWQR